MHRDLVEKVLQEKRILADEKKKQMEMQIKGKQLLAEKEKKQIKVLAQKKIKEKELLLQEKQLLAEKESKQMDRTLVEKEMALKISK